MSLGDRSYLKAGGVALGLGPLPHGDLLRNVGPVHVLL
jgi:hypothetical protein